MSAPSPRAFAPSRWPGWLAAYIPDGLYRLKFLKMTAGPGRFSRWTGVGILLVLLAVFAAPVSSIWLRLSLRVDPMTIPAFHPLPPVELAPAALLPVVWEVERTGSSQTFSNGLRVDNSFAVSTRPRIYVAFRRNRLDDNIGVRRTQPAGIVYHTTESQQAPFTAGENRHLRRIGESALAHVRRQHAYNFLIDRFGRVYRIVPEGEVASHAGYSVWSDESWIYVNLNESFLGISFEAETTPGQLAASINPAQAHAALLLTEMLRGKYGITAGNCVTHGQVSVNPSNFGVGYHTDWASSFPFEQVGLPDNYMLALPALWAFGFDADAHFLQVAGARMKTGVEEAQRMFEAGADAANLSRPAYKRLLQRRYREKLAAAGGMAARTR